MSVLLFSVTPSVRRGVGPSGPQLLGDEKGIVLRRRLSKGTSSEALTTNARFNPLVPNPKRRAVLRPCFAPVIKPRRRNVRMAEPLLDLGDVSLMGERVGRSGGAQRVDAEAIHLH